MINQIPNPSIAYMVMMTCAAVCGLVMLFDNDEKRLDYYKALVFFFVLAIVLGALNYCLDIP